MRFLAYIYKHKILAVVLIVVLELILQVSEFYKERERYLRVKKDNKIYSLHPFLQVVPSDLNSQGFTGEPIEASKPRNAFRIFTLGGSTTLGTGLTYEDSYPVKLEKKLQEKYPDMKIEVQNAASHWYTSMHSVINYEFRVRKFNPDLIIVLHAVNDLCRSFTPRKWCLKNQYQGDYSHYLGPLIGLVRARLYFPFSRFLLFEKVDRLFDKEASIESLDRAKVLSILTPVEVKDFKSLNTFENCMDLLIELVKMDNHSVIVCSEPFIYNKQTSVEEDESLYFSFLLCEENGHYPNLESMIRGMEMFNEAVSRVATANNVPYVDLAGCVPKDHEYFLDDVHMTKEGTEIAAQTLCDYIVNHHLIR